MLQGCQKTSKVNRFLHIKGRQPTKQALDTTAPQCQVQTVSEQYPINRLKGEKVQYTETFCLHKLTGVSAFYL